MLSLNLDTPETLLPQIAKRAQARRLALNLPQAGLAARSGVSLGSIKKFERTGQIALASLLQLALVLDALEEFKALFPEQPILPATLDEILHQPKKPQRGRIH